MQRHGLRLIVLLVLSCALAPASAAGCDTAGLTLPAGFCATVFAADSGQPRHIAVGPDGTVYANLSHAVDGHELLALRDTNGDGQADERRAFGRGGATGLTVHGNWLYAASLTAVRRYPIGPGRTPTDDNSELLVRDLPKQGTHSARGLAVDDDDHLFVAIGAPSNACQRNDRVPGAAGQGPCPLLRRHGGVWMFSASRSGQRFTADKRYATGIRNMFAPTYDRPRHGLYGVQMGRDQLSSL